MGMLSKSIFFLILPLLVISTPTHLQSTEKGYISLVASQKGLDFVKDLLIKKALASLLPIRLRDIERSIRIPVIGEVEIALSNITICHVGVASSRIATGDEGIVLMASGATANLSMDWKYSYKTWLVPVPISDHGAASVLVEGMEVGLTVDLKNRNGALKLSVLQSGCYVEDISIKLDGGASWLYQGMVDAFKGQIESAVEESISTKIGEGIARLDSLLLSLPKEIPVDNGAALNVTIVNDPVLSDSTIEIRMKGLFTAHDKVATSGYFNQTLLASHFCTRPSKMIAILLHENVINSASLVYFKADDMHWIIDKLPEQALLNTARWRYLVPKLYRRYPNADMVLNVSISSPPMIRIANNVIDTTIYLDVIVDVLDAGQVTPVACISLVIDASCSAKISRNNLAGSIRMKNFTLFLNWSKIGNLHLRLIQYGVSRVIRRVFVPYVNMHLLRGFPLPLLHGFSVKNAGIFCRDSMIAVCSDVNFSEQYKIKQLPGMI